MEKKKYTLPVVRKMVEMTQKDLADAVGVSESTVSNWERGKTEPSISQAEKISEVTGVHYDSIIFLVKSTV